MMLRQTAITALLNVPYVESGRAQFFNNMPEVPYSINTPKGCSRQQKNANFLGRSAAASPAPPASFRERRSGSEIDGLTNVQGLEQAARFVLNLFLE